MKKFLPWIVVFVVLLSAVPILVYIEMPGLAKAIGLILIVTTFLALRIWMRSAMKKKFAPDAVKLNTNHRYFLNEVSPIYKGMSSNQKKELEKRIGKLIVELKFDDTTRDQLDQEDILSYTLLHVLTLYNEEYHSLKEKMIVFDSKNNTGELKIVDGKYVLINPETIKTQLKNTFSLSDFDKDESCLTKQLRDLYRGV